MIRLYIEPAVIDEKIDDIINWVIGWLYRHGYAFSYQEYDYRGGWSVDIHAKGLELVDDIFGFVVDEFGDEFRYFIAKLGAEIEAVAVCDDSECIDVWFEDLEKLEEQEHLEIEERWQRMIYDGGDDPEYREYE